VSKNVIISKIKTFPSQKNPGGTYRKDSETSEILPVAFIDDRHKIHVVMCSKQAEKSELVWDTKIFYETYITTF